METLKELFNKSCLSAGIPALRMDTCARILSVLYVHGNNEQFVLNKTFLSDIKYIQERFKISGGETPDAAFSTLLKRYVSELESYEDVHKNDATARETVFKTHVPEWAVSLFKSRYGIKLIN